MSKWILDYLQWWDTETLCYILTHHSGVCRPGQRVPLEPSTSPGDDPEDGHTYTHTHSGERSNKMYPLKDCRALNFLLHQQEIQIPHDQEISLLLEKLICGSSQGNKALEERLSRGEWISLRNVYIVRAIELINRVTDKEESITVALKHLPGS